MTTRTLDLNNIEQKIFWTLAFALGAVLCLYLYSALSLTLAVVDRGSINRATHELASKVSVLESEYITQTNSITLAYAKEQGFHEVNAKFTANNSATFGMAR